MGLEVEVVAEITSEKIPGRQESYTKLVPKSMKTLIWVMNNEANRGSWDLIEGNKWNMRPNRSGFCLDVALFWLRFATFPELFLNIFVGFVLVFSCSILELKSVPKAPNMETKWSQERVPGHFVECAQTMLFTVWEAYGEVSRRLREGTFSRRCLQTHLAGVLGLMLADSGQFWCLWWKSLGIKFRITFQT